MDDKSSKPHGIMISVPYQGHLNPYVNLALKLASKGFTITLVHTEYNHHKLTKSYGGDATTSTCASDRVDMYSEAREAGLDVRYATISDGFPMEFDRDNNFEEHWRSMIYDFPARVDEFIGETVRGSKGPHFLVTDTVYTWPATIAQKYNLVNVSFWTQTTTVFSLLYHWDLLKEKGHIPCKDDLEEEINYVPGVESLNTRDLIAYLKESASTHIVHETTCISFELVKSADFILHNTVHELEPDTLSVLNKIQPPNYAVGPINFSKIPAKFTVKKSLRSESDCGHWLGSKSPGSVFYVSFGSLVQISKEVIQEIAYGLLLSEVYFIWVVRPSILISGDSDILPDGFENETKDRGLVVPWCNQIEVLSNPAVGGFLTHCGWNSTLESMWCGIPMLCYPIFYDQPTNMKLVVDDWKIGIRISEGASIERKEVAEEIKNLMSGTTSKRLRQEADKVKGILRDAVETDGSSERNFNLFVSDLKKKFRATTSESISC